MVEKTCTTCKITKSISEFRIRTRVTPKPRSTCKACEVIQKKTRSLEINPGYKNAVDLRKWEKDNPEKFAKSKFKRKVKNLGLIEQIDEIEAKMFSQLVCEICEGPQISSNNVLSIDHCHSSGKFRGLLCSNCNFAIGLFKDDTALMKKAIEYIDSNKQ